MTSPVDVSVEQAADALADSKRFYEHALSDARLARYAAYGLIGAAIVIQLTRGFYPALVVVVFGAFALAMATNSRAKRLERRLWFNQARKALVEALAEQRGEQTVIDLRDSTLEKERLENERRAQEQSDHEIKP